MGYPATASKRVLQRSFQFPQLPLAADEYSSGR